MGIRIKLLSAIVLCALGFVVFAIASWNTIITTKVNGEWYLKIVQGKDLIADVLPPPEYIIEAYLVVFQMMEETDEVKLKEFVEKSKSLREDYEKRHRYWGTNLPDGPLKEQLVVTSYRPAMEFFNIRDKEVIPSILHNDVEKAHKEVMNKLKPLYEEHRMAIDKVVKGAEEKLKAEEAKVEEIISNRAFLLLAVGFIVIGTILLCGVYMNHISSAIIGGIGRVVAGLAESSGHISSSADHLTTASQQLAEGASEQASSLEETSSSLEEMASMTKQNAENASQANLLMGKATEVIGRADDSMNQLTVSMSEISNASKETQRIIKTIDEIAFQTNLLALNAAVEAARAGEVGAGFAVVADEVRNLAMRAADAAKNTADLIEGTVIKVKVGSDMVSRTNEEFQQVTSTVIKSGELVREIAAASQEQAQGIEQINKAVIEMGHVTQQNAANAEESASASEEMNSQAEQMKAFVGSLVALVGGNGGGIGNEKRKKLSA